MEDEEVEHRVGDLRVRKVAINLKCTLKTTSMKNQMHLHIKIKFIRTNKLKMRHREMRDTKVRYQDSSVVRFLRNDYMVSGSNPPSVKLSFRVRRVSSSSVVWWDQEEGPGHCLITKKLLSVS